MSTSDHHVCTLDTRDWQVTQDFERTFRGEDDGREKLLTLYRNGKRQRWYSDTRIDRSQDIAPENPAGMPAELSSI